MKPILLLTVGLLIFASAEAQSPAPAAQVIRVDDLPRLIEEKNEKVQSARLHLRSKEERTGFLSRSFLPTLAVDFGEEEFKSGNNSSERREFWNIEGRVNLFRGGRDRLEERVRLATVSEAKVELDRQTRDEIRRARKAYWQLTAVEQLLRIRKEAATENETQIRAARRRAGAGVTTTADVLQFELNGTLLKQETKKLEHDQEVLKNQLALYLGLESGVVIAIDPQFPHPPDHEIERKGVDPTQTPEIRLFSERMQAANLRSRQAGRWWVPQVEIYSRYGLPSLDDEFQTALRREKEFAAGIRVDFVLSDGLEARKEAAARQYEAGSLERSSTYRAREIANEEYELLHHLKLIHDLIHDADTDIRKSKDFLKMTKSEYARGVKNGPDMLEATRGINEFQDRRIELYREFHETRADLFALTGE